VLEEPGYSEESRRAKSMTENILFVDDDIRIVKAFERALHNQYAIEIAASPKEALDAVLDRPFAVVVSDLNMPGMNGIEFLRQVNSLAPHTIGILLTGWADLEAAIEAVNEGHIFRFLRKPCPHELLTATLDAALRQHRLICAEKDILRETLIGAVAMLMDLLAAARPEAFGHAPRIRRLMGDLARELNMTHLWELEAAGLLSLIGCISVPPEVLEKYFAGMDLRPGDERLIRNHPAIACQLIRQVSRLWVVARIVEHQMDPFDGTGALSPEALRVAIGSQMLRVATDFERLLGQGLSAGDAAAKMGRCGPEYNPQVLEALDRLVDSGADPRATPDLDLCGLPEPAS
jgi:response regulator RpfG family c-di-GMP phosphodiesterase